MYHFLAHDKHPRSAKETVDAKGTEEKKFSRDEWDDDSASGSHTRSGPGINGRGYPTDEDSGSYRYSRSHSRESVGDGGHCIPGGSREVSEERGRRERPLVSTSRDASSEGGPGDDCREGSAGSRREQRDDHRLAARSSGMVPITEATGSDRMHGHINRYDSDEKV